MQRVETAAAGCRGHTQFAKKKLIFDFSLHRSAASRYASRGATVREDVLQN
jgi:hypothetical protein